MLAQCVNAFINSRAVDALGAEQELFAGDLGADGGESSVEMGVVVVRMGRERGGVRGGEWVLGSC
jgi:hypothetical protein